MVSRFRRNRKCDLVRVIGKAALKGFTEFTVDYQASVDEPLPLFRRERIAPEAVEKTA